jgi:iron complex outermembrane recepter protein
MGLRSIPATLTACATLGATLSTPVLAQQGQASQSANALTLEEVIVTAQRREEAAQDVPISIAVFSQKQLDNANITNASDLANYTPSLQTNNRFGAENTTFSIRGFTQELRTTASVGVYFGEVIAPRGANTSTSGDGAGPGDFFDLQSVQVLKGPQGTLFGRNTTGGAILLTPNKPSDEWEGYLEGSVGNMDMWRAQGVINVPVGDRFRFRLGIDHQERDGYLDNISDIGPDKFADVDYTSIRFGAVIDITDNLENYTLIRNSQSRTNGYPNAVFACNPSGDLGFMCVPDLADREAEGKNGFYQLYNFIPHPVSQQELSQIINTLTWNISDTLTLKNILSYAELETKSRTSVFATNWQWPPVYDPAVTTQPFIFQMTGLSTARPTTDQKAMVAELQLQGSSFNGQLAWQTGIYWEKSEPKDDYGSQSPAIISCLQSTVTSPDPEDFRCNDILGALGGMRVGSVESAPGGVTYENPAAYAQGTYDFNDQWSLTAGIRFTKDKTKGYVNDHIYQFPGNPSPINYYPYISETFERRTPKTNSDKPTWMVDVDYNPTEDVLTYAKYVRGYRQGSISIASISGLDTFEPETVDNYEIGTKMQFSGPVPGTFNVSVFYNDFQDQQIQFGYFTPSGTGTTSIINAGSSTIKGVEVESTLQPFESLIFSLSYTYLDTHVDELTLPELPPDVPFLNLNTSTAEGEDLSFAPHNKLNLTAKYRLPIDARYGEMSASATYIYVDKMQAASRETTIYATMPDYELVNFNLDWERIGGSTLDLSLFGTNVFDKKYTTYVSGLWLNGFESRQIGQPRMYGVRLRYNFGA